MQREVPGLSGEHQGNLECEAHRVVPLREGMSNLLSVQKAGADMLSSPLTFAQSVSEDFPAPDPPPVLSLSRFTEPILMKGTLQSFDVVTLTLYLAYFVPQRLRYALLCTWD